MTDNTTPGTQDLQINAAAPSADLTINQPVSPTAPETAEVPTAEVNPPTSSTPAPTVDVPVQFVPIAPVVNENPFSLQATALDATSSANAAATSNMGAGSSPAHDQATAMPIGPAHNQMKLAFAVIAGILVLSGVGYGSYWYSNRNVDLHDAPPAETQTTDSATLAPLTDSTQSTTEDTQNLTQSLSQSDTQAELHGSACEQGMVANGAGNCVCNIDSGYFAVDQSTSDALAVKLSNNTCASCDLVANRIDALAKAGDALSLKLKTQLEITAKEHGCGTTLANYDDKIKAAFDHQDWAKYLQLSFEKFDITQKNLPQANALKWKILFTKDLALKLSQDKTTTSKTMEFLKTQISSLQNELLTQCPSCVDTKKACADMTADYATVARFDKIFDQNQDTLAGPSLAAPAPKKVSRTKNAVTDINTPDEAATKALDLNTVSFSKIFGSDYYVKNCLSTTTPAAKK